MDVVPPNTFFKQPENLLRLGLLDVWPSRVNVQTAIVTFASPAFHASLNEHGLSAYLFGSLVRVPRAAYLFAGLNLRGQCGIMIFFFLLREYIEFLLSALL
jgi:hypothetical protein